MGTHSERDDHSNFTKDQDNKGNVDDSRDEELFHHDLGLEKSSGTCSFSSDPSKTEQKLNFGSPSDCDSTGTADLIFGNDTQFSAPRHVRKSPVRKIRKSRIDVNDGNNGVHLKLNGSLCVLNNAKNALQQRLQGTQQSKSTEESSRKLDDSSLSSEDKFQINRRSF